MSRMTLLDGNLWLSLSAEHRSAKAGEPGYPPHNIELLPGGERGPALAVAGFRPDELEVSVEDGELTIRGKQSEEAAKDYIHRGIAARQFKRTFALANGVEVRKAELHNGLLAIELERPRKEKKVLKVGIAAAE